MKTYRLHLIRHGITAGNLDSRYIGGGTDEPLCQKGKDHLMQLKEKYEYPKVSKLYTSPMVRAAQSCKILYPDMEYDIVDGITECNFGEFENETFSDLGHNSRFARWISQQDDFVPEGGESNREFAQRCAGALNEILMDMMKNGIYEAACVTHGGVIALLLAMFGYPRRYFQEWTSDSGCGFTVITTTEMWTRDNVLEAVEIVPKGWVK